jgi:signal transduction histidine kinase
MSADEPRRTMQHAMNNPLTALMAEIQLLQMEDPTPATAATCERMMALVRRLIELSRKLGDFPEQP